MFEFRLTIVLLLGNIINSDGGHCKDFTKHKNYNLVLHKPHCGRTRYGLHSLVAPRIANASMINIGEYPWLIYIEVYKKPKLGYHDYNYNPAWTYYWMCAGCLINNRYVITSAGCLILPQEHLRKVVARVGEWWLANDLVDCQGDVCASPRQVIDVEEVVLHQNIDEQDRNDIHDDICLLRLSNTVSFNEFVRPICLPFSCYWQEKDLECYDLTLAGWGDIQEIPWAVKANIPQQLRVTVTSQTYCQNRHKEHNTIKDSQICARGDPSTSACEGDRGGPLTIKETIRGQDTMYLVGITSYGAYCKQQDSSNLPPSVYTKVSYFLPWILDNIRS